LLLVEYAGSDLSFKPDYDPSNPKWSKSPRLCYNAFFCACFQELIWYLAQTV